MPARRSDTAHRLIKASGARVYRALTDEAQYARWIAPDGARAAVDGFDPRPGGALLVTLTFDRPGGGKTTADSARSQMRCSASSMPPAPRSTA